MNLDSLEYLMAVARQRSFTKAAMSISISQQGLSKSIKHLENELGIKLLDRSGRKVILTDAALELEPEITTIISAYRELQEKATRLRSSKLSDQDSFRVYATAFFTEVVFGALEDDLIAIGLDKVPVMEEDIDQIISSIEKNPSNTIALVNLLPEAITNIPVPSTLLFEPLFAIESVVVASTKLLSPRISMLTKKHITDLPLAYLNEPLFNQVMIPLFEYYQPKNIITHTSNLDRLYKKVKKGEVAMITDSLQAFMKQDQEDLLFFPMDKPVYTNVGFLHAADSCLEPEPLRYLKMLRDQMQFKWRAYIKKHPPMPQVDQTL